MKVNKDISCIYFSFLAYQRGVQLLYETKDTLIEAFPDSLTFTERQTDKSKDQAPKQHHYLNSKNNFVKYRHPNYMSKIGPD